MNRIDQDEATMKRIMDRMMILRPPPDAPVTYRCQLCQDVGHILRHDHKGRLIGKRCSVCLEREKAELASKPGQGRVTRWYDDE